MARIFYSMAGEGRGHAARVRTLVEHLRHDHELVLFASDEAYDFLARCYGPEQQVPNVRLMRIPGLRFHYTNRKLDLWRTISSGLAYAFHGLPQLVAAFRRRIRDEQPDLILSDFEPALPRAATAERVPYISIDHQHVLMAYDLRSLPWSLKWHAWSMSWAVWLYYTRQTEIITSSFYHTPLKPGWERVRQVGPLIRAEVAAANPHRGNYLLSYLRANTPDSILDVLQSVGRPIKVYGLGERPPCVNLIFCPIHETQFVTDLANCEAVICAAGNQLLGESLYLGKPVLALPEAQHHEQRINAHYLQEMGVGMWTTLETLDAAKIEEFLARLPEFQQRLFDLRGQFDGTAATLQIIQDVLSRTTRHSQESVPVRAA
ncbi:teichoic acid biosynthesis protein [bacterium]|nr:teichoic acid biosynthesis protein [bacterium]